VKSTFNRARTRHFSRNSAASSFSALGVPQAIVSGPETIDNVPPALINSAALKSAPYKHARNEVFVPMRVAVYARVSLSNGHQDPELQLRELREHCACRGWEVAGEYVDRMSGAKDKRPQLDRLTADAHLRRFDVVIVWRFDRFARSVSHLLRALETFRALGIEFVSLSEQVDTLTPMGKMVFTVLAAVAELERSIIVERVRAGLRNARAKGTRLGRPRVSSPAKIRQLRNEGLSLRQIANRCRVSKTTVIRLLK